MKPSSPTSATQGITVGLRLVFLSILFLALAVVEQRPQAEVLFDNTQGYLTNTVFRSVEFGDEIRLARAATNLSDFQFSYHGDFLSTGRETARLRLYLNDGPDTDPGPKTIPGPGTVFYDSGPMSIYQGLNTFWVSGLSLSVPQAFTWTVEFAGLTGAEGNRAGLQMFNPVSTGRSFDDFWEKRDAGWQLFRFGGDPVANFGARIEASETPLLLSLPTRLANGAYRIEVTGPVGRDVLIEFSTNSVDWTAVQTNRLATGAYTFIHTQAPLFSSHFYRGSIVPTASRILSTVPISGGGVRIDFEGPSGVIYELQSSADGLLWITVDKSVFPTGSAQFLDPEGVPSTRYRLTVFEQPLVELVNEEGFINNIYQLVVFGPPGHKFQLQASEDLERWRPVHNGVFDFTAGQAVWADTNATRVAKRFFRTVLIGP